MTALAIGGKMAALGLDEAAVRAQNSQIIYASLSAYGTRGPDYLKPGYDAIIQARTGIMSVTGQGADSPTRAGVSIVDPFTAARFGDEIDVRPFEPPARFEVFLLFPAFRPHSRLLENFLNRLRAAVAPFAIGQGD